MRSRRKLLLRVRAVGLNFRDVLNVLGEYPGDPGPPGGDAAGAVGESPLPVDPMFGLAHAPLASVAVAAGCLLVGKPTTLSFEQACTLPVTWSTTHAAVERAALRAGTAFVVQAAAGGVGLKAVEYARGLHALLTGTAGRLHKHARLREIGVNASCSSRDAVAFAIGAARRLDGTRLHALLNSLSLDFIPTSFASLGEGGAFEEIGKRGIWASERHRASASTTSYCVIALDADMAVSPDWMRGVLGLLSVRAAAGVASSLPLQSFSMEMRHEKAFRTLQSGLNTGKIVVSIAAHVATCDGVHVVTGGTGGLGLLTGRWLAQRGARSVFLASRSGALTHDASVEWEAMKASLANLTVEPCDTTEVGHVARFVAVAQSPSGVWHSAGVLADAVLPKQSATGLAHAFSPKASGAWSLHATSAATSVSAFTLFSSVAALLGGSGQANYAAANAGLDALASCRRMRGAAAVSMQWGAWAEVGMAARGAASERMAAMEAASGFARIGLAQGLGALGTAIRELSPSVLSLVPVVWSRFLGAQVELVDNARFAVSPAEAAAMDPCQRLLLEAGYGALHDAEIGRTTLDGSLTGIFLGIAGSEFAQLLALTPAGGSVYAATGSSGSIAAGRLAYVLALHGPSNCVTGCRLG